LHYPASRLLSGVDPARQIPTTRPVGTNTDATTAAAASVDSVLGRNLNRISPPPTPKAPPYEVAVVASRARF